MFISIGAGRAWIILNQHRDIVNTSLTGIGVIPILAALHLGQDRLVSVN